MQVFFSNFSQVICKNRGFFVEISVTQNTCSCFARTYIRFRRLPPHTFPQNENQPGRFPVRAVLVLYALVKKSRRVRRRRRRTLVQSVFRRHTPANLYHIQLSTPPMAASAPVRAVEVACLGKQLRAGRFIRPSTFNRKGSHAVADRVGMRRFSA